MLEGTKDFYRITIVNPSVGQWVIINSQPDLWLIDEIGSIYLEDMGIENFDTLLGLEKGIYYADLKLHSAKSSIGGEPIEWDLIVTLENIKKRMDL